jgi:hypothetical protein
MSFVCLSVLLLEGTEEPRENHRPVACHWKTLSHNVVHLALIEIRNHNISNDRHWLVMIGIDCKSSCKSNYHMITTTTVFNVICNTSSMICLNLYVGMFRHYVVHRRCDCWWHLMASRITVLTASSFYKYTHNPCKWTLYNSFYSTYISICGDFIVLKLCCSLNVLHHCMSYKTYHRGCN